jgi:hypothetical protein
MGSSGWELIVNAAAAVVSDLACDWPPRSPQARKLALLVATRIILVAFIAVLMG